MQGHYPMRDGSRHSLALAAFLACLELGANGLSSSAYGPEKGFLALGGHAHLSLYLALATVLTVFIIALAYNQVIELFPTGGGGYRVATKLLGPYPGLISGVALFLDYVLAIAVSVAAGVDVLASLLPLAWQDCKLWGEAVVIGLLVLLKLRGQKIRMSVLLLIFLGFLFSHLGLIGYGIFNHVSDFPVVLSTTFSDTGNLAQQVGWTGLAAMLLLAYVQSGATYAGLEAVSNNIHTLAQPRVPVGKLTMFFMALTLALLSAGMLLLYCLWDAHHVAGQTLNASTFQIIIDGMDIGGRWTGQLLLAVVLMFEAALLFVAAGSGFFGGPVVLSNLAADSWVPHQFRYLSTRLVTQNGVLFMGLAALGVLFWSGGSVSVLIVLYATSVFLSLAISLFGLCRYWWRQRSRQPEQWQRRFLLSALGFVICTAILLVLFVEKFVAGGAMTILFVAVMAAVCMYIRRHYRQTKAAIRAVDQVFSSQPFGTATEPLLPVANVPTAVFIVGTSRGGGLHALLWVQRMFPGHFKNFIFVNARTVDMHAYGGDGALAQMRAEANATLQFFVDFCRSHAMASSSYLGFGTDAVEEVARLCDEVGKEFPQAIFFTSKLIFDQDNWFIRLLHNQAALAIQRRMHFNGLQMVILPMKV